MREKEEEKQNRRVIHLRITHIASNDENQFMLRTMQSYRVREQNSNIFLLNIHIEVRNGDIVDEE